MSSYQRLLKHLLFRMDPERAHNLAMRAITSGLVRTRLVSDPRLRVTWQGLEFSNPLGLAAGVDKNGEAVERWRGMGFGFAEIGTVTALAQPGNPRPRLFRYPQHEAIVNRMGFNNDGAEAMARHLQGRRAGIPLGINLGKSKVTELEAAPADYAISYGHLRGFADYVVVNVSSPNTPGLRSLQNVESLQAVVEAILGTPGPHPPLLIKLSPDMASEDLYAVVEWVNSFPVAGLICTNTTLDKSAVPEAKDEQGGLSGRPLLARSNGVLRDVSERLQPEKLLIGVGGIMDAQGLWAKLELGANLAQVYSGWVFGGPGMPAKTLLGLLDRMSHEGLNSVSEITSRSARATRSRIL